MREKLRIQTFFNELPAGSYFPVDIGCKLNVHKPFRKRPGRLVKVLCTFNLRPVSGGFEIVLTFYLQYLMLKTIKKTTEKSNKVK